MFVPRVHGFCHNNIVLTVNACPPKPIRSLHSSANTAYAEINILHAGSLFLGPFSLRDGKFPQTCTSEPAPLGSV